MYVPYGSNICVCVGVYIYIYMFVMDKNLICIPSLDLYLAYLLLFSRSVVSSSLWPHGLNL